MLHKHKLLIFGTASILFILVIWLSVEVDGTLILSKTGIALVVAYVVLSHILVLSINRFTDLTLLKLLGVHFAVVLFIVAYVIYLMFRHLAIIRHVF